MYDQTRPGVSNEKYASFTEIEKTVFDLIVSQPAWVGKGEVMEKSGLSYGELIRVIDSLQRKQVPININFVGGMYWSFNYCIFAEDHDKWVNKN